LPTIITNSWFFAKRQRTNYFIHLLVLGERWRKYLLCPRHQRPVHLFCRTTPPPPSNLCPQHWSKAIVVGAGSEHNWPCARWHARPRTLPGGVREGQSGRLLLHSALAGGQGGCMLQCRRQCACSSVREMRGAGSGRAGHTDPRRHHAAMRMAKGQDEA